MASMHAYKTVFALKKIAKDILYSPEDILTNEATSDEIVKDGFNILIKTDATEEDIREIVQPGYDLTKVEVYECTAQEFQLGFEAEEAQILDRSGFLRGGDRKAGGCQRGADRYCTEKEDCTR